MKHLIRRLSRVADSSSATPSTSYALLRSDTALIGGGGASPALTPKHLHQHIHQHHRRTPHRSSTSASSSSSSSSRRRRRRRSVPSGHLPVYVGEEMERFVVSADLLNHPVFVNLLNRSAQEYGYEQQGALHIRCNVELFERVLDALDGGHVSADVFDLIHGELFL